MGEGLKDARRVSHPTVCGLCGLIRAGMTWVENRRATYDRYYAEGLCPDCRVSTFVDPFSRRDPGKG